MRTALLVSHILSSGPRFVLAIDPFALDSAPWMLAALYSGVVSILHVAWHRQSETAPFLQRRLIFRRATYRTLVGRVLRLLHGRTPVSFAYAGGVERNGRLLYGVKEFVQRVYKGAHVRDPRAMFEKLYQAGWVSATDWSAFREHRKRLSLLRFLEREVIRYLSTRPVDASKPCHETGTLSPSVRDRLRRLIELLGYSPSDAAARLSAWEEEFGGEVPFRERLWRVLLGRVVKRGAPLLVMTVVHNEQAERVTLSAPVFLESPQKGEWVWGSDPFGEPAPLSGAGDFARSFSRLHFQGVHA